MRYRFLFTPDAVPTGGAPEPKSPVRKPKFPLKAADFAALTLKIAGSWLEYPGLTLIWTNQTEFETKAKAFDGAQHARMRTGGTRPDLTKRLRGYDKQANQALPFLKGYIREKWEDKELAQAQYARYGIRKIGANYKLPADQQQRLEALGLIVDAISEDGFDNEKYGLAFWGSLKTDYETVLGAAGDTDGTVSLKVGDKNTLREELSDIMTALQLIIIANYPKTWAQMFREWGWQKEDY